MHVIVQHSKWSNWEPAPADVIARMTPEEIAAALARNQLLPEGNGRYRMRVVRAEPKETTVTINEMHVIGMITHAYSDKGKSRTILKRHEAVGELLAQMVLPALNIEPSWVTGFVVDPSDAGPDENFMRATLTVLHTNDHGRAEGKIVDPEHHEPIVEAYLHPMSPDDHAEHLHRRFGIKRRAKKKGA